jgi:hypothetical protein
MGRSGRRGAHVPSDENHESARACSNPAKAALRRTNRRHAPLWSALLLSDQSSRQRAGHLTAAPGVIRAARPAVPVPRVPLPGTCSTFVTNIPVATPTSLLSADLAHFEPRDEPRRADRRRDAHLPCLAGLRADRREGLRDRQRGSRLAVSSPLETYLFRIAGREQKLSVDAASSSQLAQRRHVLKGR